MSEGGVNLWMVGSIGIDDVETRCESRSDLLGGSLPFATAAGSFYTRVGAVGVVGSDFPQEFEARWQGFGVDLAGVQHQEGRTFRWSGRYSENMIDRETLKTELGVFESFTPELPESYRKAGYILLGNIQPQLQLHVLEQAVEPKFVVLDTMNLWIDIARPALLEVISRVDLLTVNDSEARQLAGCWNLLECGDKLLELGPEYLIIKKGEHGALLFTKASEVVIVPAWPVRDLVDPTGAGDTFAGALLGYLAQRDSVTTATLREGLVHASVVASIGVEGFSTERLEGLSSAEIERRVGLLKQMAALQ